MAFEDSDSKDYLNLKWSTTMEKEQKTEEILRTKEPRLNFATRSITPKNQQKRLDLKTS